MSDPLMLICHLRTGRRRAREAAIAEACALWSDLGVVAAAGGPLSEQGGVFWMQVPVNRLQAVARRIPRLGYTTAVDCLEPKGEPPDSPDYEPISYGAELKWRGRAYRLARLYAEDADQARDEAPDRREFLFEDAAGAVRAVRGYRGDGGNISRRGLAVCDARLLVNLAATGDGARLLDPFAGVGGIVREAVAAGCVVMSSDIDPALRHGLRAITGAHCVADASRLPFADGVFDAVATEPPYHEEADGVLIDSCREIVRVLRARGRLSILCATRQAPLLSRALSERGMMAVLETAIDRKGLGVTLQVWEKACDQGSPSLATRLEPAPLPPNSLRTS